MKLICRTLICLGVLGVSTAVGQAQTPPAPQAAVATDVYHVMFVKATPGQAAALATELQQTDPKDPMGAHFLLLRHQEGADWDYCVIQHVGTKASVELTPPPPNTGTPTRAWHDDTFVSGPSWPEFQRAMGLTDSQSGNSVYVVGVHRAVPGHRSELLASLTRRDPASKAARSSVLLTHLEGGSWQFMNLDRYASWQDFAADRAANAGAGQGWSETRQHSASHTDTIADRVR